MNEKTVDLLNEIAKNTAMGKAAVEHLLKISEDAALCHHLHKQLALYEDLGKRAAAMLAVEGAMPKEQGALTKASAQVGITMQTIADKSPRKLAEMLIEGSHMGATEITEALRDNKGANEGAVALGV
ncbi:MAG: hypothetical protein RR989_07595, partial [Ruthenibacterium sp.]